MKKLPKKLPVTVLQWVIFIACLVLSGIASVFVAVCFAAVLNDFRETVYYGSITDMERILAMGEIAMTVLLSILLIAVVVLLFWGTRRIVWHITKYKRTYSRKACPDCGKRLAECEKDNTSIRLNAYVLDKWVDHEYYCPHCDKRVNKKLLWPARINNRKAPEAHGTRYIRKRHANSANLFGNLGDDTVWRIFGIILAIMFAAIIIGVLPIFLTELAESYYSAVSSGAFIILMMILLIFLQLAVWCVLWTVERTIGYVINRLFITYYEVTEEGLIVKEPFRKRFYAWEDFRLLSIRAGYFEGASGYVFDLEQRVLIIDSGVEYYINLAESIMEPLRGRVPIGY